MKKTLILAIILFASQAWGATYYVKSGGNDSAAGTSDTTAWAHCPGMLDWTGSATLKSGDIVYFRSQDSWSEASTAEILETTSSGVTYIGDSYGSGTRARFYSGGYKTGYDPALVQLRHSNITFQGFEVDIDNRDNYGITVGYGTNVDISNITVDNCIVHDYGDSSPDWGYGILVTGHASAGITVSNVMITNCTVYNCANEGIALYDSWPAPYNRTNIVTVNNCTSYNNKHGLIIVNDTDNATIQNCNIYNNSGNGIWVRTSPASEGNGMSGGPDNAVIKQNRIYGNATDISIQVGTDNSATYDPVDDMSVDIFNNFLWNSSNQNIIIGPSEFGTARFRIYNNTIYNSISTGSYSGGVLTINPWSNASSAPTTLEIKNNIIFTTQATCINDAKNHISAFNNNLIYRSSSSSHTHVNIAGTTYNRSGVLTWDSTAQNTDPLFANIAANDFRIQSGSRAIDNGTDLSAYFTTDYYGSTIPQNSVFDIGAYQSDGVDTPINDPPTTSVSAVQGLRVVLNGIPITSVNASSNDGNIPENTLDNDLNTRWSALGSDEWIEFDLGAENTLEYALIAFYLGDQRSASFRIQVSNDRVNWQDAFVGNSSSTTLKQERFNFVSGTKGRFVRYIGYGNSLNEWNSVTEFDVF